MTLMHVSAQQWLRNMFYINQEQKIKITSMLLFVNNHIYDKEFYDLFDSIVNIYIYILYIYIFQTNRLEIYISNIFFIVKVNDKIFIHKIHMYV